MARLNEEMQLWRDFAELKRPEIPLNCLPEKKRDFLSAYCEQTNVPLDFATAVLIGTVTASVFDRVDIELRHGRRQPLTLYSFIIAPSGSRKTAPFIDLTQDFIRLTDGENARRRNHNRERKIKINALEKQLAKKNVSPDDVNELTQKIVKLESEYLKYLPDAITDTTMESLQEEATRNVGNAVLIMSDESSVVNVIAGRSYTNKGNTPNVDFILKAYENGRVGTTRKGQGKTVLPTSRACIVVAGQEVTLQTLTRCGEQSDRGFPQRCLIYYPDIHFNNRRENTRIVPGELWSDWTQTINGLFDIPRSKITVLKMSDEANQMHSTYDIKCGNRHEQLKHYGKIGEWVDKNADRTARLAGALQLMTNPESRTISSSTFEQAERFMEEYFYPMARHAFGLTGDTLTDQQARMIQRIRKMQSLPNSKGECTIGTLKNTMRHNEADMNNFDRTLRYLKEHDYIRIIEDKPQRGPRKHIIIVNPNYKG